MVLDRALTDAEIGGDVLAGMARKHQIHDHMFPRRQVRDAFRGGLMPGGTLDGILGSVEGALDAGDQFVGVDRLLDEIHGAGFHGSDGHRHVAITGDHDGRQLGSLSFEPLQQREPAHALHLGVDDQAALL